MNICPLQSPSNTFDGSFTLIISVSPLLFANVLPISKSSLIAKYSGEIVGKTDSVQLDGGTTADAIIHFEDAFKHIAGNTEVLKIFAPVFGANDLILTSMSADNFRWIDDLGVVIPGPKNSKFYKEQTGQAVFH